ncbi:unnamed protein product, partial [Ectocarpus sp. 8 AP-2014]
RLHSPASELKQDPRTLPHSLALGSSSVLRDLSPTTSNVRYCARYHTIAMAGPVSSKADIHDLADSTDLTGKRVFVRVDLNAPLSKDSPPAVTDATRLKGACPTIEFLADQGARVILASHLGRPKKKVVDSLRMDPVAARLSALLGKEVIKMDDCVGAAVEERISSMGNGDIMLLENVRFHSGEEGNDETFSKQLAALCDYYVNDAFGTVHRAHASTSGITKFVERKV